MLTLLRAGPALTIQDLGRPGLAACGLSRGGAADRLAILEGAALLGQPPDLAAIEMAVLGGTFRAEATLRIALTGAPMPARIGSRRLDWNRTQRMQPGDVLEIGAAGSGGYGYLSVGGGLDTPLILGSRSAHLAARIGKTLVPCDRLATGPDPCPQADDTALPDPQRTSGGIIRLLPTAQTALFPPETLLRFQATPFARGQRGNRQGVALHWEGPGFFADGHLGLPSEPAAMGDIQLTGDGAPVVLGPECQTTGGYPRIGSIHPADLPRVLQAAAPLRFAMISLPEGLADPWHEADLLAGLRKRIMRAAADGFLLLERLSEGRTGGAVDARADPFAGT